MIDRNELRRLLNEVLYTDADLDAFCLDYFPEIQQRFSAGMDRIQRVNLLLQLVSDPEIILDQLRKCAELPAAQPARRSVALARPVKWTLRYSLLSSVALLLLSLFFKSTKPLRCVPHGSSVASLSQIRDDAKVVFAPKHSLTRTAYPVARELAQQSLQRDSCRGCSGCVEASPRAPDILFGKLPHVSALIGRDAELKQLDAAWDGPSRRRVVAVIAVGGQGKTTLVVNWLLRIGQARYRGARRVFFWSFYNQGTSDRWSVSSDEFMATALRFFGDPAPDTGHPLDKAYRLAKLLRKERSILFLDGLEPLQHPPRDPEKEGLLADQALAVLLQNLAADNPGMVVITSRVKVADLEAFDSHGATQTLWLRPLSNENGVALLRNLGVRGLHDELVAAVRDFKGHPLALALLGNLLRDAYAGDIRRRIEIGLVAKPDARESQAQRALGAYDKWFGLGPEGAVLRLLGLFDRFAPEEALSSLRAEPVVPGLNESLAKLKQVEWNQVIARLRSAGLVDDVNVTDTGTIDAHPLVREYFGDTLRRENEAAWREGHRRLYAWYAATAKDLPNTAEEMEPLYAAVLHGCRAGNYQQALSEVFERRIRHGIEHYSINKLGAFGADLSAMSNFFEEPWIRPMAALDETSQFSVLFHASYALRGLGRMKDAVVPMRLVLQLRKSQKQPGWATTSASNLSEVELALGQMEEAKISARQGVELADLLDVKHIAARMNKAMPQQAQHWIEYMKERWVISRTTLADALHQQGKTEESRHLFVEAEGLQQTREPAFPILHGLEGYQYCDLLLAMGRTDEVLRRAKLLIARRDPDDPILAIAMNSFSLGRAYLARFAAGDSKAAASARFYLDEGVARLRQSGYQDYLAYSLTHRAAFFRHARNFSSAVFDLDEALRIATRGQMLLAEADAHLERARLFLAQKHLNPAREELLRARMIVVKTGYHRRDPEVVELARRLGKFATASRPVRHAAGSQLRPG